MKSKTVTQPNIVFAPYPSITNDYALDTQALGETRDQLWYGTEKINGANFSIAVSVMDGVPRIKFFNRTREINARDTQYVKLFDLIYESGELMGNLLRYAYREANLSGTVQVVAYGEFFGSDMHSQKSNYDVDTQGKNDIRFFNVALVSTDGIDNVLGTVFLSRDIMETIIPKHLQSTIVARGDLITLLLAPLLTKSVYGGDSEGIVYQPFYGSRIERRQPYFMAIKRKTAKYLEVNDVDVSNAVGQDAVAKLKILGYITENRLANILSHGDIEVSKQNFKQIMDAFTDDIVDEYLRDNPDTTITESNLRQAIKKGSQDMTQLIKHAIASNAPVPTYKELVKKYPDMTSLNYNGDKITGVRHSKLLFVYLMKERRFLSQAELDAKQAELDAE